MEPINFQETLEKMTTKEREVAFLLYIKDIKDLLESLLDSQGIKKKHY